MRRTNASRHTRILARRAVRSLWADRQGLACLAIDTDPERESACRIMPLMAVRRVLARAPQDALPLSMQSVDRMLLLHAHPDTLAEAHKALKPEGRVIVIAVLKGICVRAAGERPYALARALARAGFTETRRLALAAPRRRGRTYGHAAVYLFGGIIAIEALKRHVIPPTRLSVRRPVPLGIGAVPAR